MNYREFGYTEYPAHYVGREHIKDRTYTSNAERAALEKILRVLPVGETAAISSHIARGPFALRRNLRAINRFWHIRLELTQYKRGTLPETYYVKRVF